MSDSALSRALGLAWRAVRLRCPNCGGDRAFASWFRMNERCRSCNLVYDRGEDGYLVGAYMFNIVAAELLFMAGFLGILFATWPNPPWDLLTWLGPLLIVTFPVICYPFSKTLFLAFDLFLNPVEPAPQETP